MGCSNGTPLLLRPDLYMFRLSAAQGTAASSPARQPSPSGAIGDRAAAGDESVCKLGYRIALCGSATARLRRPFCALSCLAGAAGLPVENFTGHRGSLLARIGGLPDPYRKRSPTFSAHSNQHVASQPRSHAGCRAGAVAKVGLHSRESTESRQKKKKGTRSRSAYIQIILLLQTCTVVRG